MDGFGGAVVVFDMPEPCMFLSLNSCQKMFLWTYKETDSVLHPVIVLVLHVMDAQKFPQALGFESLDPLFRVCKQDPGFTAKEEDGGDNRLVQQDLYCTTRSCLVWPLLSLLTQSPMHISTEQLSSLHRAAPKYLKLVTSSNFWSFMLMSALMLFVLLVMLSLYSVLTSIPCTV